MGLNWNQWQFWGGILTNIKEIAIIVGIIIALLTYITNSYFLIRTNRIENMKRFLEAHENLFEKEEYIVSNIKTMEDGTYKRDLTDKDMELKFNRLLSGVEKMALLTAHGAIPKQVQIYMFGWFAERLQPVITGDERNNIYWELAIHYLDELKKAASDYSKLNSKQRAKYLKKRKLIH